MRRVAVIASHPIQYQAPWFRALAQVCDLTVLFCHRQDAMGQAQAGFGAPFEWDVPLLEGYPHEWLSNVSKNPGVDRFGGCDTPGLASRLAAGRFDACIVNGWYLKSYLQAIRACRALAIPALMRGDSQLKGPRSPLTLAAKSVPYRWLLRRVDGHLYVGQANLEYLQHYGVPASSLFRAPHCVDNERFAAGAALARQNGEAARLRGSWDARSSTTVFLFVGKFIDKKRPADLIAAAAILAKAGHDIRAVFVGSGANEAILRARAADAGAPASFDGFQNQTRIASWYAAADCLVLPSDGRETWGLVVNEAMAAGRPAIVSDEVGCAPDLIVEGKTGFTFPMGHVRALADRMVDSIALCGENAAGARMAVLRQVSQYSIESAVAGAMHAIDVLTSGAGRGAHDRAKVQHV